MNTNESILKNYTKLKNNVKKVCKRVNRDPNKINIVVVTKNQDVEKIKTLLNFGHINFGENRLKEGQRKWTELDSNLRKLHFIGALQSKKVKKTMEFFDVIETLDTERSAENISKYINDSSIKKINPKIFIQINIGNEIQKRGIKPSDSSEFLKMCKEKYKLNIKGAMCMAPYNKDASRYFSLMHDICKKNNLKEISMGMSNDYETAILYGATNIRVGSLIFGKK